MIANANKNLLFFYKELLRCFIKSDVIKLKVNCVVKNTWDMSFQFNWNFEAQNQKLLKRSSKENLTRSVQWLAKIFWLFDCLIFGILQFYQILKKFYIVAHCSSIKFWCLMIRVLKLFLLKAYFEWKLNTHFSFSQKKNRKIIKF